MGKLTKEQFLRDCELTLAVHGLEECMSVWNRITGYDRCQSYHEIVMYLTAHAHRRGHSVDMVHWVETVFGTARNIVIQALYNLGECDDDER
jgi:hypothetical protein